MGEIFDNVEVLNLKDADLNNLSYEIHASEIIVGIDKDRIKVKAEKKYLDINGKVVLTKDASYYVTDPEQISYWNDQLSSVIKPAIENRLKSNDGIV